MHLIYEVNLIFTASFNLTPELTEHVRTHVQARRYETADKSCNTQERAHGVRRSDSHTRWRMCCAQTLAQGFTPGATVSMFYWHIFFPPPQLSWRHAQLFFSPPNFLSMFGVWESLINPRRVPSEDGPWCACHHVSNATAYMWQTARGSSGGAARRRWLRFDHDR